MIAIAAQVALLLIMAFLIGLLLILDRQPRHDGYRQSPQSRSTPLGYYSAQQERRVAQGVPGRRAYVPGDESVDTVKVEVWQHE